MALRRILAALTLLQGAAASTASSQAQGPAPTPSIEILAAERANNREQRVVFRLGKEQTGISGVALRSGTEPVQLLSLDIAYANGVHKTIELSETILPGRQSRLNPVDSAQPITEVTLWKRPGLNSGETMLQLLGARKRDASPPAAAPSAPNTVPANSRYEVVAHENIDQRSERMVFRLGRGQRYLAAIKIRAVDDPLTITRAEVQFDNGEKQTFDGLFMRVERGKESRAFEITGEPQHIDRITAWKLPSKEPGRTSVELLGLAAAKP